MIQSSAIKLVKHCDLHNHVQPKLYTTSEIMTFFLAAPYIMKTEERKNQRGDKWGRGGGAVIATYAISWRKERTKEDEKQT